MGLCRDGYIFALGIDGSRTSGRGRLMGKGASIQAMVKYFLVISRMDGDMDNSFVSMSMGKGLCSVLRHISISQLMVPINTNHATHKAYQFRLDYTDTSKSLFLATCLYHNTQKISSLLLL